MVYFMTRKKFLTGIAVAGVIGFALAGFSWFSFRLGVEHQRATFHTERMRMLQVAISKRAEREAPEKAALLKSVESLIIETALGSPEEFSTALAKFENGEDAPNP